MSKKGGGGGGAQTVTQSSAPPAYLLPYLQSADTAAQNIFNQGPPPIYQGNTLAPINSTTQQALNQLQSYGSQGPNQAIATGVNTLEQAANSNPDPSQNPYIMDLIKQQGLNANQIVAGNFNSAGRYGSGAHAAAAGTAITNAQLPTLAAQYNTDMQNKLTSAAMLPSAGQAQNQEQLSKAQAVGTAGDAYTQQAQAAINDAITRFNYENGGGATKSLQNYISEIAGLPNSGSTGSTTTSAPSVGLGGQIGGIVSGLGSISGLSSGIGSGLTSLLGSTGAASGIASMLGGTGGTLGTIASIASMFSDERLKTNIKHVGEENGHKVYEFEYLTGTGQRYRGVLAQEVLKKAPEAIVHDRSGYMKVNYDLIGVNFREVGEQSPACASAPVVGFGPRGRVPMAAHEGAQ